MKVHFIAIGGSAMHNLAIALSRKGYVVTGSDDELFEPSRSRLQAQNILPENIGWDPSRITSKLDAVILGMHAREDNPELLQAKELNIPIFSYPEYIYEQSKLKKRVVIGGSHGKTTITSMLLHVIACMDKEVDYMVGAQLDGYDCMVRLTDGADTIVLEGDEYLSSPIDRRPKFHLYHPHVAIISGIAWDHINVFPTVEDYCKQFDTFCSLIEDEGTLVYNSEDDAVKVLGEKYAGKLVTVPYGTPEYRITETGSVVLYQGREYPLQIFGAHNLQNLMGALKIGETIGINAESFLKTMRTFTGAGKRLQKVAEAHSFVMYKDFAHSPSKLRATTNAVKEQYKDRRVVACMELHTFSSLKKDFLPHYKNAMDAADVAIVYFSPQVVRHKKLATITAEEVRNGFGGDVMVLTETIKIMKYIGDQDWRNSVLLMMSSGNFDGIDYEQLGRDLSN